VQDVLSIPIKAVTSREDTSSVENDEEEKIAMNTEPFIVVFVKNGSSEAELRIVETGIQNDEFIHIKKGLNENDEVITGPYDIVSKELKNKDKVKTDDFKKVEAEK